VLGQECTAWRCCQLITHCADSSAASAIDALCCVDPESAVGSRKRFDLSTSQLDSLIAQFVQSCERIVQESQTILLVGDQPTDN